MSRVSCRNLEQEDIGLEVGTHTIFLNKNGMCPHFNGGVLALEDVSPFPILGGWWCGRG